MLHLYKYQLGKGKLYILNSINETQLMIKGTMDWVEMDTNPPRSLVKTRALPWAENELLLVGEFLTRQFNSIWPLTSVLEWSITTY